MKLLWLLNLNAYFTRQLNFLFSRLSNIKILMLISNILMDFSLLLLLDCGFTFILFINILAYFFFNV